MRVYKKHTQKIACNYLIDSGVKGCFIVYYFEARYYRAPTFTSRDRLFEKYFWISPYSYCMNNPIKYIDPSGDSITMSQEAWNVQKQAFLSVFDRENNKIPFSYDKETGKMNYIGENSSYSYSETQQEIINNYKSLCENSDYHVNVQIVKNEQKILSNGDPTSLKERFAVGAINEKGNGADVYISKNPLYILNGKMKECPQREDNQSIAILHEVGGHAYYFSKGIRGANNNKLTTSFEQKCRDIFLGKYGSREIRRTKASEHH